MQWKCHECTNQAHQRKTYWAKGYVKLYKIKCLFSSHQVSFVYPSIGHVKGSLPCKAKLVQFISMHVLLRSPHFTLASSEHQSLNSLYNDKIKCLLMALELATKFVVICTNNNSTPRVLAKGTLGYVVPYKCQTMQPHIITSLMSNLVPWCLFHPRFYTPLIVSITLFV